MQPGLYEAHFASVNQSPVTNAQSVATLVTEIQVSPFQTHLPAIEIVQASFKSPYALHVANFFRHADSYLFAMHSGSYEEHCKSVTQYPEINSQFVETAVNE